MAFPVQSNITTQSATGTTTAAAFASAQSAGNFNVVLIGQYSGTTTTTVTSVTDSASNTYTKISGPLIQGNQGPVYLYWCPSIVAAASNTVTAHWSATVTFSEIIIVEYQGVANSTMSVDGQTTAGAGSATSLNIGPITTTAGDILVAAFRESTNNTVTQPSGYTIEKGSTSTFSYLADKASAAGGSLTITWSASASSTNVLGISAAFKSTPNPPPGGSGGYFMWGGGVIGTGSA